MLRAFLVSVCIILADQFTKFLIRAGVAFHEAIVLTPFLKIVHVENRGAAFGLFARLGNTFFIAVTCIAIILLVFLVMRSERERYPFALLLGGAAGNLIDRLVFGTVTDFIDFHVGEHHWPAFNVADSALTVGIIFLIGMEFLQIRSHKGHGQ